MKFWFLFLLLAALAGILTADGGDDGGGVEVTTQEGDEPAPPEGSGSEPGHPDPPGPNLEGDRQGYYPIWYYVWDAVRKIWVWYYYYPPYYYPPPYYPPPYYPPPHHPRPHHFPHSGK